MLVRGIVRVLPLLLLVAIAYLLSVFVSWIEVEGEGAGVLLAIRQMKRLRMNLLKLGTC